MLKINTDFPMRGHTLRGQMKTLSRVFLSASVCLVCASLSACAFLPSAGPLSGELVGDADSRQPEDLPFNVVEINAQTLPVISSYHPSGLKDKFAGQKWSPRHVIGTGDLISVVVWETGETGLFANQRTGNRAELGPFLVDQVGRISVPYIGWVTAKGRTLAELRYAIQQGLKNKAVDPQVVVTLQENGSSAIVVNGAARQPGIYPIALQGNRILDMIARAGGSANPAPETKITFIRDGKQGTQRLQALFEDQSENIFVRPGDQIYLTHKPQTFTAFGAVPRVSQHPITNGKLTLVEALGRVGGLDDNRANPVGVFLFRYERPSVAERLVPDLITDGNKPVPMIYRINMREGDSYFHAQSFDIRDKDILYVANSYGGELRKFFGILSGITSPATTTAVSINALN